MDFYYQTYNTIDQLSGTLVDISTIGDEDIMYGRMPENTKEIVLAHLSQEANTKEKALETYYEIFNEHNITFNNIKVASQVNVISGGNYENKNY